MPALREEEILDFLRAIEDGDISLSEKPAEAAGNVTYTASNGWKIVVYVDCDTWEYIESVKADKRRSVDYDEIMTMPSIDNYRPSDDVAASRYGIGRDWSQLNMPAEDAESDEGDDE